MLVGGERSQGNARQKKSGKNTANAIYWWLKIMLVIKSTESKRYTIYYLKCYGY